MGVNTKVIETYLCGHKTKIWIPTQGGKRRVRDAIEWTGGWSPPSPGHLQDYKAIRIFDTS